MGEGHRRSTDDSTKPCRGKVLESRWQIRQVFWVGRVAVVIVSSDVERRELEGMVRRRKAA